MSTLTDGTKSIDFWRWRHRGASTGEWRRTLLQLTLDKTGVFPEARPMAWAKAADDDVAPPEFADTTPEIGRLGPD